MLNRRQHRNLADALNLQIINFATGSNAIPDANKAVLNKAADVLKNAKSVQPVVGGHTDATGNPDANKTLSLNVLRLLLIILYSKA